ncbi:hypothetical protein [Halorientalis halophila]|uniref:hypothetical protein n=1 Tax=Halorientalis halophila TaxID=3108499 RepID=UPI003009F23B
MTTRRPGPDGVGGGAGGGTVELRSRDMVVSKTVTQFEDQVQVEVTTELDDGTYDVSTFRFYWTQTGEVVPKAEVAPELRLIVASALREEGYEPSM